MSRENFQRHSVTELISLLPVFTNRSGHRSTSVCFALTRAPYLITYLMKFEVNNHSNSNVGPWSKRANNVYNVYVQRIKTCLFYVRFIARYRSPLLSLLRTVFWLQRNENQGFVVGITFEENGFLNRSLLYRWLLNTIRSCALCRKSMIIIQMRLPPSNLKLSGLIRVGRSVNFANHEVWWELNRSQIYIQVINTRYYILS